MITRRDTRAEGHPWIVNTIAIRIQPADKLAIARVTIPFAKSEPCLCVDCVEFPIASHIDQGVRVNHMLTLTAKEREDARQTREICKNMGITPEQFIGAKGKRDSGESIPFAPIQDDHGHDTSEPGFKHVWDGRTGGRAAIDSEARDDGPGEGGPGRALMHLMAGEDHDREGAEEVCEGADECRVDHLAEAHRELSEHLRRRGSMNSARLRFE